MGTYYMDNVIEIKKLSKHFGELNAVKNLNLSIKKGEFFGLLGPNGSGKTTTIKMLTGQIAPSSGNASILGVNLLKDPIRIREIVGIIPERETPPSFLTSVEYMHFVGKIRKIENLEEKCDWWFDFLKFDDVKDVLCKDLSLGTRQKLMFAQAFLHEPQVAFIDEPLINLDPVIQRKVKDYLKNFTKSGGTIFFSTHVLEIAEELCTRIGIIDKGSIIYEGPIADLKKKKQNLEEFFLKSVGSD
jgi:ABC-2 type transport system ATP-binding protein